MTKKILSLLLVFVITMGCLAFNFTVSADSEVYGDEAIAHLKNLGILSQDIDGDAPITRAEFANAMYQMVGKSVIYNTNYVFGDVGASHPYKDAINFCAQNGYMLGSYGMFRPDDGITFIEGMTVVARVLNYTEYAKNIGDYSLGYYTTAKNIGLLTNTGITSTNDTMLVKNAAAMIYNALRCKANKLAQINTLWHEYVNSDKIFAYETLGLNFAKGVMTSNGDCDITDNGDAGKHTVVVDGKLYSSRKLDNSFKFYLGQEVSLFYDDDLNIISIVPTGISNVLNLTRADFMSKSGNTFKYYENDIVRKVSVSSTATYLKNGEVVMDFKATGFEDAEYADITLIDSNDDDEYEYVLVNVYTTFVVNSVSSDNVLSSVNNTYTVDLSDDNGKRVYVFDASGNEKSASNIKNEYIVSVIEGKDFIYVVYANTKITGSVGNKEDDWVTIDDLEVYVPNGIDGYLDDVRSGDKITAYFDFQDRIVYVVTGVMTGDGGPHGYLVDSKMELGIDKVIKLKIFTSAGNMEVIEVADKFEVNDVKYKKSEITNDSMFRTEGDVNRAMILYTLTPDGKIKSVTYPKTSLGYDEDGFIQSYTGETGQVISNGTITYASKKADGTYFSGKAFLDSATEIFVVPDDIEDEDSFAIISLSQVATTVNMTWDILHYSKYNGFADIAVLYGDYAKTGYDSALSVVISVGKIIDEKGDEVVALKVFRDGSEVTLKAPEGFNLSEYKYDANGGKTAGTVSVNNLKAGDLVRLGTDKDKNIRKGERVFEYGASDRKFKGSANAGAYATHSLFLTSGYVAYNDKKLLRVAETKPEAHTVTSDIYSMVGFLYSSARIVVVEDSARGVNVKTGSVSDVLIGDYIVYQARSGVGKYLIIYKDIEN